MSRELVLHGYWRSGASYRVRIALNLKGLAYRQVAVDLRTGAQRDEAYLALNPQGLVPMLLWDGTPLTQSVAIMEHLEEAYLDRHRLLPDGAAARALARSMVESIACDIQPLNNLRVLGALLTDFGADQAQIDGWAGRWIAPGFEALEAMIAAHGEGWAFGASPTMVDCCLIPQVYSARRFNVDVARFPRMLAIESEAAKHPAFMRAHPDAQPDADRPAA